MKFIYSIFFVFLFFLSATAQNATRVVAFAKFGADTTLPCADSGGYKYSHGRGGAISFTPFGGIFDDYPPVLVPELDFETGYSGLVKSDSSWELSPTDTDISTQYFDNQYNIIYATCNEKNNGLWQPYLSEAYEYDGTGNLLMQSDSSMYSGVWQNDDLSIYTYGPQNTLIKNVAAYGLTDSGGWLIVDYSSFRYDAAYHLSSSNGLYIQAGPFGSVNDTTRSGATFVYNNNELDSSVETDTQRIISYDIYNYIIQYYFSPSGDTMVANDEPVNHWIRRTTTYDSHHNVTAHIQEILNSTITDEIPFIKKWTYNANNQVTCERDYNQDSSGNWVLSGMTKFYYEEYVPEAPPSINTNVMADTFAVYPSPAAYDITVKLRWTSPQPFSIAMYDIAGRLVGIWDEPATQKLQQTFTVATLAAGDYVFSVEGGGRKFVKKFVVVH